MHTNWLIKKVPVNTDVPSAHSSRLGWKWRLQTGLGYIGTEKRQILARC